MYVYVPNYVATIGFLIGEYMVAPAPSVRAIGHLKMVFGAKNSPKKSTVLRAIIFVNRPTQVDPCVI